MPKVLKVLMVVVVFSTLLTVAGLAFLRGQSAPPVVDLDRPIQRAPLEADPQVADLKIPPFTLTTQDGDKISREDLLGKVTVVDFFFTHCPFVCPQLTAQMLSLSTSLKDTQVRFLSVSVDSVHDTPPRLKAYAQEHGADLGRWSFATGDSETIKSIVAEGMKFDLGDNPAQPIALGDGQTMNNIRHPQWIALLGPEANVLGIYVCNIPQDMIELEKRARRAGEALLTAQDGKTSGG